MATAGRGVAGESSAREIAIDAGGGAAPGAGEPLHSSADTAVSKQPVFRNWRALRDAHLVRQERDFSCGLASLATLFTFYFGDVVGEESLLAQLFALDDGDTEAHHRQHGVTLADLARLARQRGYRAAGLAVPIDALRGLRRPVLLSLNYRGLSHFSVLRGIDARGHVWLADPSWGNRQLSRAEFRSLFATQADGRGRILLLGQRAGGVAAHEWFRRDLLRPALSPAALRRP